MNGQNNNGTLLILRVGIIWRLLPLRPDIQVTHAILYLECIDYTITWCPTESVQNKSKQWLVEWCVNDWKMISVSALMIVVEDRIHDSWTKLIKFGLKISNKKGFDWIEVYSNYELCKSISQRLIAPQRFVLVSYIFGGRSNLTTCVIHKYTNSFFPHVFHLFITINSMLSITFPWVSYSFFHLKQVQYVTIP